MVFKNSYTNRYLFWFNLSAIRVLFSGYFTKVSRRWSEETFIFSTFQVFKNIREGFSFSVTLKADFAMTFLHIFPVVESCFIEIIAFLPVTLQKQLSQVSFLVIFRTNSLQRCLQTQSNIQDEVYCKNSLCL